MPGKQTPILGLHAKEDQDLIIGCDSVQLYKLIHHVIVIITISGFWRCTCMWRLLFKRQIWSRFSSKWRWISFTKRCPDNNCKYCDLLLDYKCLTQGSRDLVTGLKSRTNAGRPNWNKVFYYIIWLDHIFQHTCCPGVCKDQRAEDWQGETSTPHKHKQSTCDKNSLNIFSLRSQFSSVATQPLARCWRASATSSASHSGSSSSSISRKKCKFISQIQFKNLFCFQERGFLIPCRFPSAKPSSSVVPVQLEINYSSF